MLKDMTEGRLSPPLQSLAVPHLTAPRLAQSGQAMPGRTMLSRAKQGQSEFPVCPEDVLQAREPPFMVH